VKKEPRQRKPCPCRQGVPRRGRRAPTRAPEESPGEGKDAAPAGCEPHQPPPPPSPLWGENSLSSCRFVSTLQLIELRLQAPILQVLVAVLLVDLRRHLGLGTRQKGPTQQDASQ